MLDLLRLDRCRRPLFILIHWAVLERLLDDGLRVPSNAAIIRVTDRANVV
jgi:hypothetical protein